ncbi:MAG: hypothetical protein E7168_04055 [Firmicutes bacterium]|nr:hypothetical protein [Bacillota bacterium]
MSEDFKNIFDKLNIAEKRNQINYELLLIGELVKNIENKCNIQSILNIKNYNTNRNNDLSETEMLTFIYENIYNIQRELITILSAIDIRND